MILTSTSRARLGWAVALSAALLFAWVAPADAASSQASANALTVTGNGQTLATTGTFTASNDGTHETTTGNSFPAIQLLGVLPPGSLSVGLLPQNAQANNDGSAVACAGLVGSGGLISIGSDQSCTANPGMPNGISLGGPGGVDADAIYAECTQPANGAPTGNSWLLHATLGGATNEIPVNAPPNTAIPQAGTALLTLNEQTHNADGSLTVTALDFQLPPSGGGSGLQIKVGTVTCGHALTPVVSAFALRGLPLALGVVLVGGLAAVYIRRRAVRTRA